MSKTHADIMVPPGPTSTAPFPNKERHELAHCLRKSGEYLASMREHKAFIQNALHSQLAFLAAFAGKTHRACRLAGRIIGQALAITKSRTAREEEISCPG